MWCYLLFQSAGYSCNLMFIMSLLYCSFIHCILSVLSINNIPSYCLQKNGILIKYYEQLFCNFHNLTLQADWSYGHFGQFPVGRVEKQHINLPWADLIGHECPLKRAFKHSPHLYTPPQIFHFFNWDMSITTQTKVYVCHFDSH